MTEKPTPKAGKLSGKAEPLKYDIAELVRMWRALPKPATAEKLHKALQDKGFQCSLTWVKKKITTHHIIALARTANLEDDQSMLSIKAVRQFLEVIGKDTDPHAMLSGLQTRTIVLINDHLSEDSGDKAKPEWLQEMMRFYAMLSGELMQTYQKRLEAGEKLPLPESKSEKDETVLPWRGKK